MATDVFAVPELPTSSVFLRPFSFLSLCFSTGRSAILPMMYSARIESPVGIRSCEKISRFGAYHSGTSHAFHVLDSKLTQ